MSNRHWKLSTSGNLKTHIKQCVSFKEYYIHTELYKLSKNYSCLNVPKVISYNQDTETMTTICVGTSNVSDFYGEDDDKVPDRIFEAVRVIIQLLYDSGVVYPDITGYNFIESKNKGNTKLWIFDFEHAELYPKEENEFDK